MGSPSRIAGSTIMVTGGCGFIGSSRRAPACPARRAHRRDRQPCATATRTTSPRAPPTSGRPAPLARTIPRSLRERMHGVRYLFHLAAEKHSQSRHSPLDVLRSSVDGTFEPLRGGRATGRREDRLRVLPACLRPHAGGGLSSEDELPQPQTVYGAVETVRRTLLRHLRRQPDLVQRSCAICSSTGHDSLPARGTSR